MSTETDANDLIVTIVPKGQAEKILRASKEVGAEGGTILYGRGVGVHETRSILGIPIEPEKEIVLTVIPHSLRDRTVDAILEAGRLDEPGNGIIFALGIDRLAGICQRADGCAAPDHSND